MRPFVELNPRATMGHVAIALQKRIASGVQATFRVMTTSEFLRCKSDLDAVPFSTAKDGRWLSGTVRFSSFGDQTRLIPLVVVGKRK